MPEWETPTLVDVLEALPQRSRRTCDRISALRCYPCSLDELVGTPVLVKHENHQPVGAFKVRGGVNFVSQLTAEERASGVFAASTGNHGQSPVAVAHGQPGAAATICVPEGANPVKVASMRGLGADVIVGGRDFDEARERCDELARERGGRYVHSGNEPLLIAGVATEMLELVEQEPRVDVVFVPVGGGSGAAGCCIVAKVVNPRVRVVGVQSERAPAGYRSWKEGRPVEDVMETFAEGLATRVPFELPQQILRQYLDDFVLVSDDEIRAAQRQLIETTRNLIEAAGAAPLAAALRQRDEPSRGEARRADRQRREREPWSSSPPCS